jgi:N-methylhydantoinase A
MAVGADRSDATVELKLPCSCRQPERQGAERPARAGDDASHWFDSWDLPSWTNSTDSPLDPITPWSNLHKFAENCQPIVWLGVDSVMTGGLRSTEGQPNGWRNGLLGGFAMGYRIGIDMGGTFTDAFMASADGEQFVAKVDTVASDLLGTTARIIGALAHQVGHDIEGLLPKVERFMLGTTLTTNLLVTHSGSPAGFITTRGHRDVLSVAGGAQGKIAGLSDDQIRHSGPLDKPAPLVPKDMVIEVDERLDYKGATIVQLDEEGVRRAALQLRAAGTKAIGIGFLWSFRYPQHELRAAEIVAEVAPELDVTCSHRLVSRRGEYLRFSSTAINAYCAPVLREYLEQQTAWLRARGLRPEPLIMQASGGVIPASDAAETSLYTIDSGPVAGVVGAASLSGDGTSDHNVICTDMGGTTFDVGLVYRGQPVTTGKGVAHRYPFYGQIVDISSIGSGGGSIAWVDEATGVLKVGPQSAGANPGPACYGRGGYRPTVTDANVVLGYVNPTSFLGGEMTLDVQAAMSAIDSHVASKLDMSILEAAHAIYRITNGHMADFLRKKTIENGYDPRTFDLFAYGGAGPVHASAFARELGVSRVVVPLGNVASVYSALGVLTSDIRHVIETSEHAMAPFDGGRLRDLFIELEDRARERLRRDGVPEADMEMRYSIDLKYAGQMFDVELPLSGPITDQAGAEALLSAFDRRYDELFGEGAGFRAAGVEMLMLRVAAIGRTEPLTLRARSGVSNAADASRGTRLISWGDGGPVDTPTFDGDQLGPGARVDGPAVVELSHTSVVIPPGHLAKWRPDGTIEITVPLPNQSAAGDPSARVLTGVQP